MRNDETATAEYYTEDEMNHVEAHITRYFGKSDAIYHEIRSPDIHVDIVVIPPREGHNYYTLVTMGMGAHVMDVPGELREKWAARAELLINLPPDWQMRVSDSDEGDPDERDYWPEQYYWPIRWLKILARLPGERGTWLGWGHTVPTGYPLSGTNFSCLLLLDPGAWDEASHTCEMPDGGKLSFYQVVPLYEDEAEYKLDNDTGTLLELLDEPALKVVDVSRPNVCANIDPLRGIPFTRRIENFRAWFEEHERALAKGARRAEKNPADGEAFVALVSQGTALLSKNVFFNVGGDREFTFSTGGRAHLFFLYPRLVAAMRGGALERWTFHPWMRGNGGSVFELGIHGVRVDTDGVLVGIEEIEEGGDEATVGLRFYSEALATLEEERSTSAFYVLLDNALGEGLAYWCVERVARADAPEEGMITLTQLESRLRERINGEETPSAAFDPSARFFSYKREVEEKEEGHDLRDDIFMGTTRFTPLVNDYYAPSVETWRAFGAFGAKPAFLYYYPDSGVEGRALLDQRYELQDAIEAEVLGERGSEIGLLLGGAMGEERVYIDFLLYDEAAFRERIVPFAARFDRAMFLSEFRLGGDITMLFGASTPGLFKKLSDLHDAGRHAETADVISAIPQEERSYEIQSLFGRALNNIDRHEEALNILETIRERGESDPVWHFRVGYALYYLDREREAAPHFQRAIDLGLDDEKTREFLSDSLEYAEDDKDDG